MTTQPFRFLDWLFVLVVLASAGGARAWYLHEHAELGDASGDWHVQELTDQKSLIENLKNHGIMTGFKGHAPLAPDGSEAENTAHVAPAYPFLVSQVQAHLGDLMDPLTGLRWIQVGLSSLAAVFYYFLARRAFGSRRVALFAGLFCAFNPYWIINTAELNDGSLAAFGLALALMLGARAGQQGGFLTGYLFGLSAGFLPLIRAAFLPFVIVAMLWFMLRSRSIRLGWLSAIMAFLGFVTGFAPWIVRNYQTFERVIPVVDTAWWHAWIGNNPRATGGPLEASWLYGEDAVLSASRLESLQGTPQSRRYEELSTEVVDEITTNPLPTLQRRLYATSYFLTGEAVVTGDPARIVGVYPDAPGPDEWLYLTLYGTLVGMLVLAFLGWRWSYGWRRTSMPLQLAILWVPLPYLLTHAEALHGPRLPLDGPLLCLAAFALFCLVPGIGARLAQGEPPPPPLPTLHPPRPAVTA
jgi:4-amino-4-deoxy-L-arabinose transferase-like glycosyltransferase